MRAVRSPIEASAPALSSSVRPAPCERSRSPSPPVRAESNRRSGTSGGTTNNPRPRATASSVVSGANSPPLRHTTAGEPASAAPFRKPSSSVSRDVTATSSGASQPSVGSSTARPRTAREASPGARRRAPRSSTSVWENSLRIMSCSSAIRLDKGLARTLKYIRGWARTERKRAVTDGKICAHPNILFGPLSKGRILAQAESAGENEDRREPDSRPRGPRAQPEERNRLAAARRHGSRDRALRERQVLARLRHHLRRGPEAIRREPLGLRQAVPRADGQAGRGPHRRPVACGLHRSEDDEQQPSLDGRDRHGDLRLPEASVRARRAAPLPRLRLPGRVLHIAADGREGPRAAGGDALHGARAGRAGEEGRVRAALPGAGGGRLRAGAGRWRTARVAC